MRRKAACNIVLTGALMLAFGFSADAFAGGGEGDPPCLVMKNSVDDPPGARIHGTLALDATDVSGGVADVTLRLEKSGDVRFFRALYQTSPFTAPTLLAVQNRVCEILSIPSLLSQIKTSFQLPASVSHFVISKRSIRDAEIDVDPNTLVVGGTVPPHAMTIMDLVFFAQ